MKLIVVIAALLPVLGGCDVLKDRMGIPDPAKVEAEGKAVGSACRHAGRGLEDCYRLNPSADKASVFLGWKEMNEYMLKNKMESVLPEIPAEVPGKAKKKAATAEGDDHGADAKAEKPAKADDAAKKAAKDETHAKQAGGH